MIKSIVGSINKARIFLNEKKEERLHIKELRQKENNRHKSIIRESERMQMRPSLLHYQALYVAYAKQDMSGSDF